jgi:hypothetical protein
MNGYEQQANELVNRITALIPEHPEILDFRDPWDLMDVDGFSCSDLGVSAFQASWALGQAQLRWKKANPND